MFLLKSRKIYQQLDRNSSSLLYQLYLINIKTKHGAKSPETQHYLKPEKIFSHFTLNVTIFVFH